MELMNFIVAVLDIFDIPNLAQIPVRPNPLAHFGWVIILAIGGAIVAAAVWLLNKL